MKTLQPTLPIPATHRKPRLHGKKRWSEVEIQKAKKEIHALLEEARKLDLKPIKNEAGTDEE